MKLIIAGSRGIDDYILLRDALVDSGLWKKYGKEIEVVSGMAGGVDTLGVDFAGRNNLTLHEFYADWNRHGRSAGHIRNAEMALFGDELLALWDGRSNGTRNMIETMRKLGKPVHVYVVKTIFEKVEG